MPFSDFHGNTGVVNRMRDMLARGRFPQAVILAGPAGCGKYTLALMLAKAMNCLDPITADGPTAFALRNLKILNPDFPRRSKPARTCETQTRKKRDYLFRHIPMC
jgi:DNA polymerase III delta prime subunit